MSSAPPVSPDDPEYYNQWHLYDEFGIHAPEAWEITTGSASLQVAVLDNGINSNYPDLLPNSLGWDFTTNPPNPNVFPNDCEEYHGTAISSIIAAKTNNSYGISGIAGGWNSDPVTIVMCKNGAHGSTNTAASTAAIDWAVQQGIRLFNFSWGDKMDNGNCSTPASYLDEEMDMAYFKFGAIMFAAAGNDDKDQGVSWPACKQTVISVGGTEEDGSRWHNLKKGSHYGPNTDISAPGAPIFINKLYYGEPQIYEQASATSYATPMAVGVAALMLSVNPCLTNVDVQDIMQKTADKTGGYDYNWDLSRPGHSKELGYGKINAYEAVKMASELMTEIAANETVVFDEPKWFTHDLTLQAGSSLTITSTVKFCEHKKIIVEPGAQLIIDGGTLTSTCPGFWGGIEVRGNAALPQYPVSNQGYVQVIHNGRIERANPGIHSVNGGLVVATDAVFLNNRR
ncbi:MAG TPA: S8 family serine peptidase, partial [Bacteroidales bacterium]|nr:S8 family serine peptidase [Bacteroidales bacterium]